MLFSLANTPYWIFLGIGVLLFLTVIVSGLGDDDLDLDVNADVDADVDVDADGAIASWGLEWLGLGQTPLVLLLAIDFSLWGLLGWMLNVWLSGALGQAPGNVWGTVVFFGSLVPSLLLGKWIAYPVGRALAAFGEDPSSDRLIGRIGRVTSASIPSIAHNKIGQVDVLDAAHNLVTISAVRPEWATTLPERGNSVMIIERTPQAYVVIVENSLDQQLWLHRSSNLPPKSDSR